MKILRTIAFPLALIFGCITTLRRMAYNLGIFSRKTGKIKTLVVGNLTVGGTGKTPMVRWLAGAFAEQKIAVLSRGYGRKTKGFLQVNATSNAETVGDEPLEIFHAGNRETPVFVGENRLEAIEKISGLLPDTELVLLDDGFQHLSLKADFKISMFCKKDPATFLWKGVLGLIYHQQYQWLTRQVFLVSDFVKAGMRIGGTLVGD